MEQMLLNRIIQTEDIIFFYCDLSYMKVTGIRKEVCGLTYVCGTGWRIVSGGKWLIKLHFKLLMHAESFLK